MISKIFSEKDSLVVIKILGRASAATKEIILSHIIIEVTHYNNLHLIREAFYAKKSNVRFIPVLTNKFISELICQTSLQPGLSKVYEELLSFNSLENEI